MKAFNGSGSILLICAALLACGAEEPPPAADTAGESMSGSPPAAERNQAPVIDFIELRPASPRPGERLTASVEAHDADGDPVQLSYRWVVGGRALSEQGPQIVLRNAMKGEPVEVTVVARDGRSESDPAHERSVIGNRPPVLLGVVFEPLGEVSTAQDLSARPRANDPDGDTLEYRYEWRVNGSRAHEDAPTLPASEFRRGDEIQLSVQANDGDDRSASFLSEPIRIVNAPPRITSQPQGFDGEGSFRYALRIEDPDGDRLFHYRMLSGPQGMKLDSSDGVLSWTPNADQAGSHMVKLEVDDRKGGRDEQSFELTLGYPSASPPASAQP